MKELTEYKEIIIWGASMPPDGINTTTSHGRAIDTLVELLKRKKVLGKVIFIADSNKNIVGKKRLGYEIRTPTG